MKKKINIILISIMVLCLFGFSYSMYNIIIWKIDNNHIESQLESINRVIIINNYHDNSQTNVINQENIEEFDPYWDYINEDLMEVDLSQIKKTNNDVIGWIEVKNTNINYPFVQTKDNEYYLNHSFDKKSNRAGWIFMDYRNDINSLNQNTIIYGHALKTRSMFGSLKNTLEDSWLNDKSNHIIRISTIKSNSMWQIFSIYTIDNTTDYLDVNFDSNEEYQEFINLITNRSIHNFSSDPSVNDKLLTLSTCYDNSKKRLVVHAKLIKEEIKS